MGFLKRCLCWRPSPGPPLLKSLESPIARSNDFQVAIMFPTQGNWLYQLLMDYPQEKKCWGEGGEDNAFWLCSCGFIVQRLLPRPGVTWGMTEWLFWHITLI